MSGGDDKPAMASAARAHPVRMLVLLTVACVLASAGTAATAVQLAGVLTHHGEYHLYLTTDAGAGGRWLRMGEAIVGFSLVDYDPVAEVATLRRDGRLLRVRLTDAGRSASGEDSQAAEVAAIQANLQLIFTAAEIHFREGRGGHVDLSDLVGAGKYLERIVPVAGEDYGALTVMKGETTRLSITTKAGTIVSLDRQR